jgi:hypothetical protein
MRIKRCENSEAIQRAIRENQGYCVCQIEKTEDTKCMCKEFLESQVIGECHCGLYKKEEI